MRDIKFRAWDKHNNMMVYLGHLVIDRKSKYNAYAVVGGLTHGNDYELMQYTGLKDKLGKEIYEGDIIEYDDKNELKYIEGDFSTLREKFVETVDDMIDWLQSVGYSEMEKGNDYSEYSKVIGNIYENPELLTVKEGKK